MLKRDLIAIACLCLIAAILCLLFPDWIWSDYSTMDVLHGRECRSFILSPPDATAAIDFWLFQDQSVDDFEPINNCPICTAAFSRYDGGIFCQLVCEHCSAITVG
jgi:hypothetical protein